MRMPSNSEKPPAPEQRGVDVEKTDASSLKSAELRPRNKEGRTEEAERFIDLEIERLLLERFKKFNEGNNGVVLRLDVANLPDDVKDSLKERGIEFPDGVSVAKVLKVYKSGMGRKEYEMQQRAHAIAALHDDDPDYARVPRTHFFRDMELGDALRENLVRQSTTFKAGTRIEMLMMDEVKGDDIATALYKEVVRTHPRTRHLAGEADAMTFDDLAEEVAVALDFASPGGKSRDEAERGFEARKVLDANAKKIYAYLERTGARLHPGIVEKITNTMNAFHKNGIAFRDGHPRNFMVTGDPFVRGGEPGRTPETHVIDFGAAIAFEGPYGPDIYRSELDENVRYLADEAIASELAPLTVAPDDRMSETDRKLVVSLDSLAKRMEARPNPEWNAWKARLKEEIDEWSCDPESAYKAMALSPAPTNIEHFLAAIRTTDIEPERLKLFLSKLEVKVPVAHKNAIRAVIKTMR